MKGAITVASAVLVATFLGMPPATFAELPGVLQRTDEAGIFGDVIGGFAHVAVLFDGRLARAFDGVSVGGRAWIAA